MGDGIDGARAAVEAGDWARAHDLLQAIPPGKHTAASLELTAQVAYNVGEFEATIDAFERLHALHVAQGDQVLAGAAAAMVAMYLLMDTGMMSTVRGWLRTADRHLVGTDGTAAHALVAMTRAYERFFCGDVDAAREWSARAIELGTATGVTPAVVLGRTAAARILVLDGDLHEGVAQLEEVGAFLMSGGADPLTTGMMYCELICAAQGLGFHDMAAEWTEVMDTWRHGHAFGGINGRCRVHRAELLRISGPCDRAEEEALGACDELRPWMRREFGWPLVELGNIRLRRGDLEGAEAAYLEANQYAWSPQPGLALVHLARGDADGAARMIREAIDRPAVIPWKEQPPIGDLRLAPLLDAQSEIAFERHDATTGRGASDRLTAIAERYPGPFIVAWAALARGRAAQLEGDVDTAIDECRTAAAAWSDLRAPYETATARVVLGHADRAAGRTESALLEWTAAVATYRSFGAARRAVETQALVDGSPDGGHDRGERPGGASVTFVADGTERIVEFQGRTTRPRDLKGFRYIARLVAEPGREFHVLDLVAGDGGILRSEPRTDVDRVVHGGEAGLPVLDVQARDAYRRRLAEIDDDIEEARRMNDIGRLALAERDREYLVNELARAVGLGGRQRTVGGSAERARTSVARSIRYALDQLADAHPDLAARLRTGVRTGTYCSYEPDSVTPLVWTL